MRTGGPAAVVGFTDPLAGPYLLALTQRRQGARVRVAGHAAIIILDQDEVARTPGFVADRMDRPVMGRADCRTHGRIKVDAVVVL